MNISTMMWKRKIQNGDDKMLKLSRTFKLFLVLMIVTMASVSVLLPETVFPTLGVYDNRALTNKFVAPDEVQKKVAEFQKKQTRYETTIVSAYFEMENSKHAKEKYIQYAKSFLCINDPVVVFTQPKHVEEFTKLRANATEKTLIIPIELEDVQVGNEIHFSEEHWQLQYKHDRQGFKNGVARNGNLYKVWLAKTWFVNHALELNPFNSDVYLWMDIGLMREGPHFCGDTVIRHPEIVPKDDRIMLFMYRFLNENDQKRYENPIFSQGFSSFYITGGTMAGRVQAWPRFLEKMEESMVLFDEAGVGLSEDQSVMQSTCMRNPGLCAVTRLDNTYGSGDFTKPGSYCKEGNYFAFHGCLKFSGWRSGLSPFFSTKFRFYHGGNPNVATWDPGMGIPSMEEDPGMYKFPELTNEH